jgi:hypothetical protein
VRPFSEVFDRGRGLSGLVMEGCFSEDGFRVTVTGHSEVALEGVAGRDAHGAFYIAHAQQHPAGAHHAIRIEEDAGDLDGSHAAITFFELASDRVARQELAYAASWYSVYFNPLGLVDGTSSCSPRSIVPRAGPN